MGADFLLYSVPYPRLNEERILKLRKLVAETPIETLYDHDGLDYDTEEEARADLDLAVTELIELDGLRDVSTWRPEGSYRYLITGGLSWGDHPTESAATIDKISQCLPVDDQLRAWAIEERDAVH